MGFSRQESWSGFLCPPPGDLPNPGIEPRSPALQGSHTLQADSLLCEPPGKPIWRKGFIKELVRQPSFPGGSDGKESTHSAGGPGLIPGSGRSPGVGNGNPLQYACLENSVDRGAWWATVHGTAKSRT